MAYKRSLSFPYIDDDTWFVTPWGEVVFFRKEIPDETKNRLIEDLAKEKEENKHKDEVLYFE